MPCDTGEACYKRKFMCDGGKPDCADGSDEGEKACPAKFRSGAAAGDDTAGVPGSAGTDASSGGGTDDVIPTVGAVVGGLAFVMTAILYLHHKRKKSTPPPAPAAAGDQGDGSADATEETVEDFSISFVNRAFNPTAAASDAGDEEMYVDTLAGPSGTKAGDTYDLGKPLPPADAEATYDLGHETAAAEPTYDLGKPLPSASERAAAAAAAAGYLGKE